MGWFSFVIPSEVEESHRYMAGDFSMHYRVVEMTVRLPGTLNKFLRANKNYQNRYTEYETWIIKFQKTVARHGNHVKQVLGWDNTKKNPKDKKKAKL